MSTSRVDAETADDMPSQIRGQQRTADVLAHAKPGVEDLHRQLLGDGIGDPQRAHAHRAQWRGLF